MRCHLLRLGVAVVLLGGFLVIGGEPAPSRAAQGCGKKNHFHIDPFGEPSGFKAGLSARYALWYNHKHAWHLRTTTAEKLHHFKGKIFVEGDGAFETVHGHDLENKGPYADYWKLSKEKREIVFDFKTDKGIDGINFRLSKEAKEIRFDLHIDGKHHSSRVYIGHKDEHPHHTPFELPAHPREKKKGCDDCPTD